MSALRLISETTAIAGVSSFNIENVFSADYDVYCLTLQSNGNVAGAFDVNTRFINSSGSVLSDSSYDKASLIMWDNRAFTESRNVNTTNLNAFLGTTDNLPESSSGVAWVFNPYSTSSYTFAIRQQFGNWFNAGSFESASRKGIYVYKQTTQITGYQHIGGFFADNTIARTYGLRVDS